MKSINEFLQGIRCKREDFQMRKRPSKLGIAVFDSIDFVPESEWNRIVPEQKGLMRHPYLRAIERSSTRNQQSRYVLIYKGGTPVAAAIFQIVVITGESYGAVKNDLTALERLTNSFKDKAKLRVLVCGHTHISGDHGFIYTDQISGQEAYHALADACYKIRRSEKLQGKIDLQLIKDFYEDQFAQSRYLQIFKYHQFKVDPNMILKIRPEWKSFDDYLAAMNTKYRKKALSVVKQGATLERRSLTADDIRANGEIIHTLYLNVANRAKVRINHFDFSYFLELKTNLQDAFDFTGYYCNGLMVGFTTVLLWGDKCEAHAVGMDYDVNSEFALYQNFLYDFVKKALAERSRELILGRTAMEMKSNIGAEPYEMYCYVRHSGPLLNRAFKPVFNYIRQTEWTQRSPFKETQHVQAEA